MASTNPANYWNQRSRDATNPKYYSPLFVRIFISACVKAATIINQKNATSNDNDSTDADSFIERTGVDDVVPDENTSAAPTRSIQSQKKIKMFRDIFRDHYNEIVALNPRKCVLDNIRRMLSCGDPSRGGVMYGCPDCQQSVHFSPFHCGSRFCPSCGNKYNMQRANAMACKIIDAPHKHVTFTIPEELRLFFRLYRDALDDLFAAVDDTFRYLANSKKQSLHYEPGFISVLHTFGRDLKWNPHVHVLFCTRIFGDNHHSRDLYLYYPVLRKTFQRCLLDRLKARFGKVFSKLVSLIYSAHPNGFYVHAPNQNVDTQIVIKYIGRYLGRPPIASSRINNYDGKSVTFHYTRHEDNKLISTTVPVLDFIKMLIMHIPNRNFKMVRYFGYYSSEGAHKASVQKHNLKPKNTPSTKKDLLKKLRWRESLIQSFGVDPLLCPLCGSTMEPIYVTCNGHTWFYPSRNVNHAVDIHFHTMMDNWKYCSTSTG